MDISLVVTLPTDFFCVQSRRINRKCAKSGKVGCNDVAAIYGLVLDEKRSSVSLMRLIYLLKQG